MGNAAQSAAFPYELDEGTVQTFKTGWELKSAWQKSDRKPVSVFIYTLGPNESDFLPMNYLKKFRTIRHPNLLQLIEGVFMENKRQVYVVTERVRPLDHILDQARNQKYVLSWGIHQVMKAVGFLNDSSIIHGNIGIQSVFVNKQGDWKLGGFELMTEYALFKDHSGPLFTGFHFVPNHCRPPELCRETPLDSIPVYALDSWMSGCFIFSLFSRVPFVETKQLKQVEVLPQELKEQYIALITANHQRRAKVQDLINRSSYFQNPFVESCLFLEEINVKDGYEKERFFLKLTKQIDEFPQDYCKYKILPHLVSALDFGAGSTVLEPLLKIAKNLKEEEYNAEISPSVIKWFKSPDRQLRMNLLENFSTYAQYLSPALINEHLYPSLAQGFLDQTASYRDLTIKAIPVIISKMNTNNINNHLLRCLAKLQADIEPSIRHSATDCVAKIAEYLSHDTRAKVLVPAFTRSLRDPYVPARLAGIQGFSITAQYHNIREVASRIVPALSIMCIDPAIEVRESAVKALKLFVTKIEEGQGAFQEASQGGLNAVGGLETTAETVIGWALSSLSSKLIGSIPTDDQSGQTSQSMGSATNSISANTSGNTTSISSTNPSHTNRPTAETSVPARSASSKITRDNWEEDDWQEPQFPARTVPASNRGPQNVKALDGWGDDDWNDSLPTRNTTVPDTTRSISSRNNKDNWDVDWQEPRTSFEPPKSNKDGWDDDWQEPPRNIPSEPIRNASKARDHWADEDRNPINPTRNTSNPPKSSNLWTDEPPRNIPTEPTRTASKQRDPWGAPDDRNPVRNFSSPRDPRPDDRLPTNPPRNTSNPPKSTNSWSDEPTPSRSAWDDDPKTNPPLQQRTKKQQPPTTTTQRPPKPKVQAKKLDDWEDF
jgi:SCY1-like protein 1